ncbi:MAG TPA: AraC family transcriptional regulator [Pirellulales bacterium]|jgi:AraC family transcriptional regulator|nr:AraC family transcriptional regulator [Pirellulales bacterium]
MDPVRKALWFAESHSRETISLEAIAEACDVSPFHLTRAFAASTGLSLMRYVRSRRLSEAARQLAQGADDILRLALDAGYGSHEAFTRAFVERFSITPEQLRSQGHFNNLHLQEAITMSTSQAPNLAPPRFETLKPRLMAGIVERYNCQSPAGIPDQWQRFVPYLGSIPGQVGKVAYGVCYDFDREGNFDYMCAVEVTGSPVLPKGMTTLSLAAQRYAVFTHHEHIAGIRSTIAAIWSNWLPESGHQAVEAPTLERYGPEFDPKTGLGGVEIWIPIQG